GASLSPGARDGDVIGVLPGYDRRAANPYLDIVVPTGMQIGRNVIVAAMADVVIAVGGGAGTLSESAIAWQVGKAIPALGRAGGGGAWGGGLRAAGPGGWPAPESTGGGATSFTAWRRQSRRSRWRSISRRAGLDVPRQGGLGYPRRMNPAITVRPAEHADLPL